MEFVFGLLVMTLAVSHGVETQCDGRQDGAQCFAPLGGTVNLQLMDSFSQIPKYTWTKDKTKIIFRGINDSISSNVFSDRSSFTPSTGKFRINNLIRTDSGEYRLDIFNSKGQRTKEKTLYLTVQAPVSDVLLATKCLSEGKRRALCDYKGDSPQFSWTLDGKPLRDGQIFSRNSEGNDITVRGEGHLVCTVSNNLSEDSDVEWIDTCGFTFVHCTLINGTAITDWVPEAIKTLCSTEGVETKCDSRQDGAQCFGPLGGTVNLQLVDSFTPIPLYSWYRNKTERIFRGRKDIVTNVLADRSSFTPSNGAFRIHNLIRTDSGEYRLDIFHSNGQKTEEKTLHLTVQAPVSYVLLITDCLSEGKRRASCVTERGDSPQFSWTLDGKPLTDDQILSRNSEGNNITVRGEGHLVCTVSNNVSENSDEWRIDTCGFTFIECILINGTVMRDWMPEENNTLCITTTTPSTSTEYVETSTPNTDGVSLLSLGVRAAAVILMFVPIIVYFAWKKKKKNQEAEDFGPGAMEHQQSSFQMVEMRRSASEL